MRFHQWKRTRLRQGIVLALALAFAGASIAFVGGDGSSRVAPETKARLEATIFTYDGQDFVRTQTTLLTKAGKSAVNTKLEHDTPAYKALVEKRSFTGDANIFGRNYDAYYAPLTGEDGRLTGALFVGVAK
jgi:Cache 3/Cache 2 fusion domain